MVIISSLCDHSPKPRHHGAPDVTYIGKWTKDGLFAVEAPGAWSLSDRGAPVLFNLGEG